MALLKKIDQAIRPMANCSLVLGFGAAFLGMAPVSDYLLAAGILLHASIRFERWWQAR